MLQRANAGLEDHTTGLKTRLVDRGSLNSLAIKTTRMKNGRHELAI
jgi:hypothetical protein